MNLEDRTYSPLEVIDFAEEYSKSKAKPIIEATVVSTLRVLGLLKPTMSRAQANREAGSRRKVTNAILNGSLRFVKKGKNIIINRDDFEAWMGKNEF